MDIMIPGQWVPDDCRYEITLGPDGPRVAGPYATADSAACARRGMVRTWRMILRRQHYWVGPVED